MKVFLRVFSTGAPRRLAIETVERARGHAGWDVGWHWFKLFTANPLNELFAQARAAMADFAFLLPDDIGVLPEELLQLISHNQPVVDGLVPTVNHMIYWNAYHVDPSDWMLFSLNDRLAAPLEPIYQTSLACACYRQDVLQAMTRLPFAVGVEDDGTLQQQGGADVRFCRALHSRNIPMFVDTTVRPRHVRPVELQQLATGIAKQSVAQLHFPMSYAYRQAWITGRISRPPGV